MDCHFVRHHRATSKDKNVKSLPDTAATTKAGSSWTLSWNLKVPNPVSSDINKNRGCEVWRVGSWWRKGSNIEEDLCIYMYILYRNVLQRHVGWKFHCCLPSFRLPPGSRCQAAQGFSKSSAFPWGRSHSGFKTESSLGSSGPYDVVKAWVDSPIGKRLKKRKRGWWDNT